MSSLQSNPTPTQLLTAEQFYEMPDEGVPTELVRGRIITMPPPGYRHGFVCMQAGFLLKSYLSQHPIGTAVGNDTGVITERGPDSVRGPDVSYYSHERIPKGAQPVAWPDVSPDLVFEVRSPSDRWPQILRKVSEYLNANVNLVCVLDPQTQTAHLYRSDEQVRVFGAEEEIVFAPVLPDWRLKVSQFFVD